MKRKDDKPQTSSQRTSQHLGSDFGVAAVHIFGHESSSKILASDPSTEQLTRKTILQNCNGWIHQVLDNMEPSVLSSDEDKRPGRLGSALVRFDSTAQTGTMVMSQDRLHAQAQSNFSSVRANVCLYSGKWQYELQLESKGVMQLGWTMADGEFTPEAGVGDTLYSFAYDGNRKRKWNLVTLEYGETWQVGDVIGSTIDLDIGSIHFYRNGKDLGEAFSAIPMGPGAAYYPAISLAFDEKLQANFGSLPFKYPVATFTPIQQPPVGHTLRANQLLHWLFRITSLPSMKLSGKRKPEENALSMDTIALLFSEVVLSHLSQFLSRPYVVEACLVPFFLDITFTSQQAPRSLDKLNFVCDSVTLFLKPEDLKELLIAVCKCLVHRFNETSPCLEYHRQKGSLVLLADLCQNTNFRRFLLKQPTFGKTRVAEFMDLKPIDVLAIKECVAQPWWHVEEFQNKSKHKEYEAKKKLYFGSCRTIKTKTLELESLQERLLTIFLNNNDSSNTEGSSRKLFLNLFRQFLKDNHVSGLVSFFLNSQNIEQTPLPVALSYFHRLLNVLRLRWEQELPKKPVFVPLSTFYTGSVDYFSIDRLGGLLSHLVHAFHEPLAARLGEDHRVFVEPATPPTALPSMQVQVRGIDTSTGVVSTLSRWISVGTSQQAVSPAVAEPLPPGPADPEDSLVEMLDGVILLYNIAGHKQLYKISTLRDDMDKYITTLNEANTRLNLAKDTCPEVAVEIEKSIETIERKLEEQSRVVMAWVCGAVYTTEKRADLVWLLRAVLHTLEAASQQGELFAFVPDFYLETMVELCSALRCYFSPTLPLEELTGYKKLFIQVAEFLVKNLSDPRIVNLGSKDTMIEALAGFISKKQTMECLESITQESQNRLVGLLLKPYDNRPWGQSNWVLMRLWQGCGFCFRYKRSPHLSRKLGPRTPSSDSTLLIHQAFDPCPSPQYQQIVAKALSQDQELAADFLNSVLKQLNWSFSEFISMMQEIQNLSKRPERVIIDARQLKICATCFDFVVSLLRVLEMICTVCLPVFTDSTRVNTENLLERLCQMLSQILLRATTPKGCFTHVVSLEVPDLDSIDQFPVLAAVAGVLVALMATDLREKGKKGMSSAAKSLLLEPAFQIDSLKYILGQSESTDEKQEIFSLANYPQAVSEAELETLSQLVVILTRYRAHMSAAKDVDDEELCPICCAMPLAVTFIPCHHRSCKSCITHHLMDCKECFFCKTAIQSVVSTDGKPIFNSVTSINKIIDIDSTL